LAEAAAPASDAVTRNARRTYLAVLTGAVLTRAVLTRAVLIEAAVGATALVECGRLLLTALPMLAALLLASERALAKANLGAREHRTAASVWLLVLLRRRLGRHRLGDGLLGHRLLGHRLLGHRLLGHRLLGHRRLRH
jgi:hypothetical protein